MTCSKRHACHTLKWSLSIQDIMHNLTFGYNWGVYSKLIDITHAVIIVRCAPALSTTYRLFDCHSWWLVYINVHPNIVFVYLFKWIISLILFSLNSNIFLTSFFGKLLYYWLGYLPWFIWKPFNLPYIAIDTNLLRLLQWKMSWFCIDYFYSLVHL